MKTPIRFLLLAALSAVTLTTLAACSSITSSTNTPTAMQGRVVAKKILNGSRTVTTEPTAFFVGHSTVHMTPHVSTHTTTPHTTTRSHFTTPRSSTHTTTNKITETTGATRSAGTNKVPAVRTVKPSTKSGFNTLHQSPLRRSYFPFWYTMAIMHHDRSLRYILTISINGKHKQLSVSKAQYERVKVGSYISVNGSKLKVIKK